MWRKILFLISITIPIISGSAEGLNLPDDPVLDSLVSVALERNPDIQATIEKARSVEYMTAPMGSLPDPMAMVGLSGPLTDSWVGEPMAMPNVTIGLSQKFPFPGKRGNAKRAVENKALSMYQSAEGARQMLAAEVRSAYYDLAYWLDAMATVSENIEFVNELEAVARERYRVGQGLQVNVLQAQKTRTKLEDRKLAVEQMIDTARWRLARLTGDVRLDQLSANLPSIGILPEMSSDSLKARLLARNTMYKKSDFDIEAGKRLLKKSKLDYFPDFTLGATYGIRWENEMFPMFGTDMLTVRAGINIPLWAGWKQKNLVSSAAAELRMSEYRKNDVRDRIVFELEKNLLEYDRNRSRYALYKESLVPQTKSTLESARAAYQVGKLEFLDVISAQMELFDAELEVQRSLTDALKAMAAIDQLTADAAPELIENQ